MNPYRSNGMLANALPSVGSFFRKKENSSQYGQSGLALFHYFAVVRIALRARVLPREILSLF